MKFLAEIVHTPYGSLTNPSEIAKLELQRYLSHVITYQYDEKGCLDPLKWGNLMVFITTALQYLLGSICQYQLFLYRQREHSALQATY